MANWTNGAPLSEDGYATGREDLRTAIQTYISDARSLLEGERDYLVEYAKRLSNRDVLEKDMADLTSAELDKILA